MIRFTDGPERLVIRIKGGNKLKCKICNEESSKHFERCEKHYCCDKCGTKIILCFYTYGLYRCVKTSS